MNGSISTDVVSAFVGRLRLGEPTGDAGLTMVPVFGEFPKSPEFVTLEEALAAGWLEVKEISDSGSVPDLKARNGGPLGVLILDGEELAGAKQNRVLNTSVYIKPGQEIVIPVSCTEHGRWSYRTARFEDSGHVSAQALRMVAMESVSDSVRRRQGFRSDQGKVWEEVALLQERHKKHSPTSAARDVYEDRSESVRRREALFRCLPGQIGLIALWQGRVAGIDVVTRPAAYARLHARLVRSYAFDAPTGASTPADRDATAARDWLASLAAVEVTEHESPGNGLSYRFSGAGAIGAALAVDGAVLHAVAFATQTGSQIESQTGSAGEEARYPGFFERRTNFPW